MANLGDKLSPKKNDSSDDDEENSRTTNQTTGRRTNHPILSMLNGLGMSNPFTEDLNRNEGVNTDVTIPTDSRVRLMNGYKLSITVTDYFPWPCESNAVEDTRPHDMPTPIVLHSIDRSRTGHDESSHGNAEKITQYNLCENVAPAGHVDTTVHVASNSVARTPNEPPRDTDLSDNVSDHQPNIQLHAESNNNERRLMRESTHVIGGDNHLINNSQCQGQASPNIENAVQSTQTNIIAEELIPAVVIKASSTPQASDNERTTDVSNGGVCQSICPTPRSNMNIAKIPSPADSSDESTEETAT